MRRAGIVLGLIALSWPLVGCEDGGTETVTPDESKAGLEVAKKARPSPVLKPKTPASSDTKK